jgi:hypothetical protein
MCSSSNISNYIDDTSGWPVDIRCGCQICPDCQPGQKCPTCPGTCVVCKGLVKPGVLGGVRVNDVPSNRNTPRRRHPRRVDPHVEEPFNAIRGEPSSCCLGWRLRLYRLWEEDISVVLIRGFTILGLGIWASIVVSFFVVLIVAIGLSVRKYLSI